VLDGESIRSPFPCLPPSDAIDGQMVDGPEEPPAGIADSCRHLLAGQAVELVLQQISRIGLRPRQIQGVGKQRSRMGVVKGFN
jgi:hypothetical protein